MKIHPANNHSAPGFKQAVIGISDGIIILFAVTTGLSVTASNNGLIVQVGFIVVFASAILLGLGGYFAAKSRQENFVRKTIEEEEDALVKDEIKKTISLFKLLDIGKYMQDQATIKIENNSKERRAHLKQNLPEQTMNKSSTLFKTAFLIAISYFLGGIIPLLPFVFIHDKKEAYICSIVFTEMGLIFVAFSKSKIYKEPLMAGTVRLLLLGVITAGAAYMIASVFAAQ